jgi:hypothetical protein
MKLIRTVVYLTPNQREQVDFLQALCDVSMSEVVRRILDSHLSECRTPLLPYDPIRQEGGE